MAKSLLYEDIIILIGPEGAGKSTIGRLLGDVLSKEIYSLDRHRDELYAPYGYDKALDRKIYEEHGEWALFLYWSEFEFKTVSHILQNAGDQSDKFTGMILDFGAGHSVYQKPEQLSVVEELMRPYPNVFLIVPCEDTKQAAEIMEARRGHELTLNKHFLEHESNKKLAKHIIYTKDKTAEESVRDILHIMESR